MTKGWIPDIHKVSESRFLLTMVPLKFPDFPQSVILCTTAAVFLFTSCDRRAAEPIEVEEETSFFDSPATEVAALHRNALGDEPTDFLRSRASDPVHWQPWSQAVLDGAQAEQKLVFAVVGSGRFPECAALLDILAEKPGMIADLHANYVCTLVDVEAHPEMALQAAVLSSEIRRRISFPLLMWLSHEGNPVAWLPMSPADLDDLDEVFANSDAMVSRIWRDSSSYVVLNSRRDNDGRRERQTPVLVGADSLDRLPEVTHAALRRLSALYDSGTGNIDGGGGLVPSSLWRLGSTAALFPGTDSSLVERLTRLLEGNTDLLLRSPVHDPIDGGFFSARRSTGWDIPVFTKNADTQVAVALALARASVALDSPRHLAAATETLEFAKRHFGTDGSGLSAYDANLPEEQEALAYLWSQEALRELLTPDELAVASAAYGISGLGNIPPESDPRRLFFRKNSLGAKRDASEIAAELGRDPAEVAPLLEAVRKRLQAHREEVLDQDDTLFKERSRITATNARYVTTLAELAAVTGDQELLQRAQGAMADLEMKHRSPDGDWLRLARVENRRTIPARGEDLAAVMDAYLALYRLDLDPVRLDAAQSLASALLGGHVNADGFIVEPPLGDRIGSLDTFSNRMVFGDSTWGTAFGPLTRLRQLTGAPELSGAADTILRAMLHELDRDSAAADLILADFLTNAQIALADTVVFLEGTPGTPEFDSLHQVLQGPDYWAVTAVHLGEGLPDDISGPAPSGATAAHVRVGQNTPNSASNVAGLKKVLQEALLRD